MESYFDSCKKYNKILYKFMYPESEIEYSLFTPEHPISGFEMVRWVMAKILHNPKGDNLLAVKTTNWDGVSHVFIQEWYNLDLPNGFVNIVHWKEKSIYGKEADVNKDILKEELLSVSHRALYNACVDYIIKTT